MPDGVLNLSVVDVYGATVDEPIDVFFRHQTLSENPAVRDQKPAKTIVIGGLRQSPQGRYRIEVDAPSYMAVSRFINIPSDGPGNLSLTLPVNKDRVVSVDFPAFAALADDAKRLLSASTISGQSAQPLYDGFDALRKAGFLNLVTKAGHTRLPGNKTVLSYFSSITEQRGDRLFALVDDALHSEVVTSVTDSLFHKVDNALHQPPASFHPVDSYKTLDHYGNLQLTFSQNDKQQWSVDMDIDDAQGLEHIFQVVNNGITGQPTHPYNIHEILVAFQELDPGYKFNLTTGKVAGAAA
jgi:hypothetical protein